MLGMSKQSDWNELSDADQLDWLAFNLRRKREVNNILDSLIENNAMNADIIYAVLNAALL